MAAALLKVAALSQSRRAISLELVSGDVMENP
jgi:hypothetical protein